MTQTCTTAYFIKWKKCWVINFLLLFQFFEGVLISSCTNLGAPISINYTIFRNVKTSPIYWNNLFHNLRTSYPLWVFGKTLQCPQGPNAPDLDQLTYSQILPYRWPIVIKRSYLLYLWGVINQWWAGGLCVVFSEVSFTWSSLAYIAMTSEKL